VLEHLAAHPGDTKRDIARALKVKGSERQILKHILSELADAGTLEKGPRRSFVPAGELPEVAVLEIFSEDPDGEPLGRPVEWRGDGPTPSVLILPGRDETSAPGRGEKVLARISRAREGHVPYEGRIIKKLGASAHRVLGVLKREAGMLPRIEPIDRKTRYAFTVDQRELDGAQDGELVLIEPASRHGLGGPRARIVERLGSMNEPRAVSLIAIHAHGIPTDFPREAIEEAEAAKPVQPQGRTDLRKIPLITIDPEDARDHDDAVVGRTGHRPSEQRRPHRHCRNCRCRSLRDRGLRTRPRSMEAREFRLFPRPRRADAARGVVCDLCSLRQDEERACLGVRMVFDARGVKTPARIFARDHAFRGASHLFGSAALFRRKTRCENQASASGHHAAPMGCVSDADQRTRRALAARPGFARAPIIIGADGKIQKHCV
jgi:ribonuclease R